MGIEPGNVVERLVHHAQAFRATGHHAARGRGGDLIVGGLGSQHLVERIFLEEYHCIVNGGRGGEVAIAADGGGIGIVGQTQEHIPIARITQLAGVNLVVFAGTTPHAIAALG